MTKAKQFTEKKGQLSLVKRVLAVAGHECYRTRLQCECATQNIRDGVLVIKDDRLVMTVIRCKACARRHQNDK